MTNQIRSTLLKAGRALERAKHNLDFHNSEAAQDIKTALLILKMAYKELRAEIAKEEAVNA